MKKHNLLAVILLATLLSNCGGTKETIFSINEASMKEQYSQNEHLNLEILNPKNETIDSISFSINDKRVGSVKGKNKFDIDLKTQKLGYQTIKASVFYDGNTEVDSTKIELVSDIQPKILSYKIINTFAHDKETFTEGLEFYNDTLYESAGQYGKSKLLKTDYKTGKIIKSLDLEAKYFGEGITIIKDKIYQLTYKEGVGFIYDAKTWKLEKTFDFDKTEGWGMTNDGTNIYFNDSSEKIWTMNPETQKTTSNINVYSTNTKIAEINELEWIDGMIYSNIFTKDFIVVINPKTGAVVGVLDLKGLRKFAKVTNEDVLNGIAYNPKTKTIFVTGKNWDKMFEIKVLGASNF
jgi:glutaminyl-peptide cyclotransferase